MHHKPDILSLNELRCNKYWANELLNIEQYNVIHKCRVNNCGGGVAFLIKHNLVFNEIDIEFNEEIIGFTTTINSINHSFFTYYNPPSNKLSSDIFEFIEKNFQNYLLMGDLNAKSSRFGCVKNSSNGNILENILLSTRGSVLNSNHQPTFHRFGTDEKPDYHSMLDLFIGSPLYASKLVKYRVMKSKILDSYQLLQYHSAIELNLKLFNNKKQNDQLPIKYFRIYDKANWFSFKEHLVNTPLIINENMTSNSIQKALYNNIFDAAECCIPKSSNRTQNRAPLPSYILEKIRKRNKLQRIFRADRSYSNKIKYYELVDEVKLLITEFNSNKWRRFINKIGSNVLSTAAFWKRINRIRTAKTQKDIPTLIVNDIKLVSDEQKAEAFGRKLETTFNTQADDSIYFNQVHDKFINNFFEEKLYLHSQNDKSTRYITFVELVNTIKSLNNKTSEDKYGISNIILKNLPDIYKFHILNFFNHCLETNFIPDEWKYSIIKMIHKKKGEKHNIKNYRPISSTPCLMKLFEKIMLARLVDHLETNNLLIKQQSGFRSNRQTKDNLFFITQKILESFCKGKKVCCILFDIKAAFDKVWHRGLLYKLHKMNIPHYLFIWIMNFLDSRKFQVKIGNYITPLFNITCGVPQGACLSPTLFSIFINDLPLNDKKNEDYSLLFADDLAKFKIFNKINSSVEYYLNTQLYSLQCWLSNWHLKMAPEKCCYIILSHYSKSGENGKKGIKQEKFDLFLYGKKIPIDNNPTFLGMTFDKYLSFKNQISFLINSCNDRLDIIKVLSHKSWNINSETLIKLYKSLVRSIIDYSIFIFNRISVKNKMKLQTLQNNALRIIYNKYQNHNLNLNDQHAQANLETLNERALVLKNRYLDNAVNNSNPIIKDLIEDYNEFKNQTRKNNIKTLLD